MRRLCNSIEMLKVVAFIVLLDSLIFNFVSGASNFIDDTKYLRHRRQTASSECILPPHPEHGRWKLLNGEGYPFQKVLVASILTFECKSGYKLSSNIPLVCLGRWSSQAPECEELCPPLYTSNTYDLACIDKIGTEVNCSEATHGTNLEYTCKTYYETPFHYKKSLFCENGKWDNPKPVCQPVCGKKISNDTQTLIYGSKPNEKLLYPWIAAVYKKMSNSYENICGGSILSQTVILTAAHCVTNNYGDVLPIEDYMVGVGKLYRKYQAAEDTRAQYLEIFKIIVPEEYKADIRKYTADIAVLVVKGEITLSEVVQPVCFTNMKNIHLHAGNKGEVSGWGLTEGDVASEILRTLVIPYKYETVCADELPSDWADRYNFKDKICAGFVNKSTSVCRGDSGNGLAFKYRDNNRYYIHGIISLSHQIGYTCNIQQNSLYTRVASYYEFVDRLLTIYATKVKDCVLPPYPQNGKWTTVEHNLKPGDTVPSNTILEVKCDPGFKLSSTRVVECSTAHNLPSCKKLCPKLKFSRDTLYQCTNRKGQAIACSAAVDGTILWYSCPFRYKEAGGFTNRTCVKGSWGTSNPECIRECGKKNIDDSGIGLEHPWNVAIYKLTNREKYKYVCGGSLVSEYIIVTASRCVTDESGDVLPKDDYVVAAGKIYPKYDDLRDTHPEIQISKITYINVQPTYKMTGRSYCKIALLIASSRFFYNNFVQPLCVPEPGGSWWKTGDLGKMVGWRFPEGDGPETIVPLDRVIVLSKDCKIPHSQTSLVPHYFLEENTCLRFMNESTYLRPEDLGNGVIIKHPENDRYYLGAVVDNSEYANHFWAADVPKYSNTILCAISSVL